VHGKTLEQGKPVSALQGVQRAHEMKRKKKAASKRSSDGKAKNRAANEPTTRNAKKVKKTRLSNRKAIRITPALLQRACYTSRTLPAQCHAIPCKKKTKRALARNRTGTL
jgi:hypothetical protein